MSEFRILELEGSHVIALYDGPLTGVDVPSPDFKEEHKKRDSHWQTLGQRTKGTSYHNSIPTGFDTEQEARDYFRQNEQRLRAMAPPNTTGP
jgi:hypothetical protein